MLCNMMNEIGNGTCYIYDANKYQMPNAKTGCYAQFARVMHARTHARTHAMQTRFNAMLEVADAPRAIYANP